MIKIPIVEDSVDIADLVNEFLDISKNFGRDYPNYQLLTNSEKKYILLKFILVCVRERIKLRDDATIKTYKDQIGQDIVAISSGIGIAFSETFSLPKDVKTSDIRNLVKLLISNSFMGFINYVLFAAPFNLLITVSLLKSYIKYGVETADEVTKRFIYQILSDEDISMLKTSNSL